MNNQNINQIINNLEKCDYDFALNMIIPNFKGNQKSLLIKFLNKEISADSLKRKWGQINLTGNILEDVQNEDLKSLDRLKLMAIILDKLNLKNNFLETYKKAYNTPEDYVKGLAFLVNSIQTKDKLRVRNKESFPELVNLIRNDDSDTDSLDIAEQCGLIPHEPPNYQECTLSVTEIVDEVNTEEEEIEDLETVVI